MIDYGERDRERERERDREKERENNGKKMWGRDLNRIKKSARLLLYKLVHITIFPCLFSFTPILPPHPPPFPPHHPGLSSSARSTPITPSPRFRTLHPHHPSASSKTPSLFCICAPGVLAMASLWQVSNISPGLCCFPSTNTLSLLTPSGRLQKAAPPVGKNSQHPSHIRWSGSHPEGQSLCLYYQSKKDG